MFSIRVKQLKRRITNYYHEVKDLKAQQYATQILPEIFGENWEEDAEQIPPIQEMMVTLEQINVVGQIFARAISHLAAEDPHSNFFYKISVLYHLGKILTCTLADTEIEMSSCVISDIQLSKDKYNQMQEELRPIKKNRNNSLTTIESIVKYIIDEAEHHYKEVHNFETWNEVLSFVFDVDVEDRSKGVKELKQTNIKELLLSEGWYGELIQSIFQKYDGLLTYTMSMLTMIQNTPYSEKFTPHLNKILEKLGTSTKIILLQGRLTKDFEELHLRQEEIITFKSKILEKIDSLQIDTNLDLVEKFFNQLIQISEITTESEIPASYTEIENYNEIASNVRVKMTFSHLDPIWKRYHDVFMDIRNSLINLDEFFDKMIRGVNDITADLFVEGFQAALPLHDIESCERAGIHVKNLTATSSTQKTKISDEDFDLKQKLLREFENLWGNLSDILKQKSNEEDAIQTDPKVFTPLYNVISSTYTEWTKHNVLSAFSEEAIMVSRYLNSMITILQTIYQKIEPYEKKFLNNDIMKSLQDDLDFFTEKMNKIHILQKISLILNGLTKNLWQLNRDFVLQVGEDPKYIQEPQMIEDLVQEIPNVLKREFIQRLITREHRQKKMEYYQKTLDIAETLKNVPIQERDIILPFAEIKSHNN